MIEVNLQNIPAHIKEYNRILGTQFISQMEKYNTTGLKRAEVTTVEAKAHPFAQWWYQMKQDIKKSQENGVLHLSQSSLRCLYLLSDLLDIQHMDNCNRIIKAIKEKGTFYSGCFEASIAAGYSFLGCDVAIIPELSTTGQRTCDLVVSKDGKAIYVECKSLNDLTIKSNRHWTELQRRLGRELSNYKRNWSIDIQSTEDFKGKDIETVFKPIQHSIRKNDLRTIEIDCGKYIVNLTYLADWDQEYYGNSFDFKPNGEVFTVEAEMKRLANEKMMIKNPHIISVKMNPDMNLSGRIIAELRKASRQIPKEGPGIVHIELPYNKGQEFLNVIDSSYNAVFKKLNKDSSRINAIVISSKIFELGDHPLNKHLYVIPNYRAYNNLPETFTILGCEVVSGIDNIPDTGRIDFGFTVTRDFEKGKPGYILRQVSNDGRHQIQLWKTWDDLMRVDLITPVTLRKYNQKKYTSLRKNQRYKICISWDIGMLDFNIRE